MTGGAGNDTFNINADSKTGTLYITDFRQSGDDSLNITGTGKFAVDSVTAIGNNLHAVYGNLTVVFAEAYSDSGDAQVAYDALVNGHITIA